MVGSQVRESEVKDSRVKASLFHSSRVGALTLINEVTPRKANGRMTVCAGLWGSFTVEACVVSGVVRQKFRRLVDGHVINLTLHRAKAMVVKMWDMYGLVDHNVIFIAGQRVIIGKRTTNSGISFSAEGGVIPFDNNRSVIVNKN
jgi:hypothetical protein